MKIQQPIRGNRVIQKKFSLQNSINTWNDFKNLWKPIKFTQQLNNMNEQQISQFWNRHLVQLTKQQQKICILVPNQVQMLKKNQQIVSVEKQMEKNQKKKGGKDNKKPNQPKVNLKEMIKQIAQKLIKENYSSLDCDYNSLYLGNDKQLLIYRKCYDLDKYIQKYRLPLNFKQKLKNLEVMAQNLYKIVKKRNKYISLFYTQGIKQTNQQYFKLQKQFSKQIQDFTPYISQIFQDFKTKQKAKQIIISSTRGYLIQKLKNICSNCDVYIHDKWIQCQNDQIKDIIIVKKDHPRNNQFQNIDNSQSSNDDGLRQYVQSLAQIQQSSKQQILECPSYIDCVEFVNFSQNLCQCKWDIYLPLFQKNKKIQNIIIRSLEDNKIQYIFPRRKDSWKIQIMLKPYKVGVNRFQIFSSNSTGQLKNTQKIIFYNEFDPQISNFKLTTQLFGQSFLGLNIKQSSQFQTIKKYVKQISIHNGVIICDYRGNVAYWGNIYDPQQSQAQQQAQSLFDFTQQQKVVNIPPQIIFQKQHIRKVSCGSGHSLMLSSFGKIWSLGLNESGQLGLGHNEVGQAFTLPQEVYRAHLKNENIIVDILASVNDASFAIDQKGMLFRWGFSQCDQTKTPIYDNFNNIKNFTYSQSEISYNYNLMAIVPKQMVNGKVKHVYDGLYSTFALTQNGQLYGWGRVKHLGYGKINGKVYKDTKNKELQQIQIQIIVNPIFIKNNILFMSSSKSHTIIVTKDKKVLGCGKGAAFSSSKTNQNDMFVQITDQIENIDKLTGVQCGLDFTIFIYENRNLKIISAQQKIKTRQILNDNKIKHVACSNIQPFFSVTTYNK